MSGDISFYSDLLAAEIETACEYLLVGSKAGPFWKARNGVERVELMRCYLVLFGPHSIAWLLAGCEFIGGQWIVFC